MGKILLCREIYKGMGLKATPTENKGLQPNRRSVEEARHINKLRMQADAVKAVKAESGMPEMPIDWEEKHPVIIRRGR